MRYKDTGKLLLEAALIDQETLDKAIATHRKTNKKLAQIVVEMGIISEKDLLTLIAQDIHLPFVDLRLYNLNMDLVKLLSEGHARQYNALVLERQDRSLLVGMVDPLNINAVDAISRTLRQPIKTALVSESALLPILDRVYRRTKDISRFAKELSGEMGEKVELTKDTLFGEEEETAHGVDARAPVVKLLNSLFRDAVQVGASDIHIEPDEKALRIRYRIDGILSEYMFNEKSIATALIQRLKLRANLDIAEHRIPQDGSFDFEVNGMKYDVRLSTIPTAYGQSLVMRILQQSLEIHDLGHMGMNKDMLARLESIYNQPYGMLLVTGPTGSGKSTTLYSILAQLNTPERKIITAEDPVEYRMPRVNQVQVNPAIDLTFAVILRSILRQDPDIIMVGEIRDTETALIAMRAAITGHLVLATLHTNNAWSSAMRLIDMGAEGYMVAAAVKAIVGQRLVRLLCKVCMQDHEPDEVEVTWLLSMDVDPSQFHFKDAFGCSHCGMRGYTGRTGVYELLELNSEMLVALRLNDVTRFVNAVVRCESYTPLSKSVLGLVTTGITSISEAIRVVGQLDEEFKEVIA